MTRVRRSVDVGLVDSTDGENDFVVMRKKRRRNAMVDTESLGYKDDRSAEELNDQIGELEYMLGTIVWSEEPGQNHFHVVEKEKAIDDDTIKADMDDWAQYFTNDPDTDLPCTRRVAVVLPDVIDSEGGGPWRFVQRSLGNEVIDCAIDIVFEEFAEDNGISRYYVVSVETAASDGTSEIKMHYRSDRGHYLKHIPITDGVVEWEQADIMDFPNNG